MTRIHLADNFIGRIFEEVYRVGGSVRDEIIGRRPKDADYLVRGVPLNQVAYVLEANGCKISKITARDMAHLGWRTSIPEVGLVEIVLPRTERGTGNGRDMEITVDHTLSLAKDAERRDFTFNALYKGVGERFPETAAEGGVIDPTGYGLNDLQRRIIRVTHVASFMDDPLRMLRALRFVSTLNADIDAFTLKLMYVDADKVHGLSAEGHTSGTVLDEFSKLLMGQSPAKALRIARDTGVLAHVMPELAPMLGYEQGSKYHDLTTDEHTFKALETAAHVDASLRVRWALLFHDSGKPDTAWVGDDGRKHYYARGDGERDHEVAGVDRWRAAAARLNAPKALRRDVATLIEHHMVPTQTRSVGVRARRMRVKFGDDLLRDLLLHRVCDLSGKQNKVAQNHIQHIAKMEELRRNAAKEGVPTSVKDLEIGGKDALALGMSGHWIGGALSVILDDVVCDPSEQKLSREWQLKQLEKAAEHRKRIDKAIERSLAMQERS